MKVETEDYVIEYQDGKGVISGVMRLASPAAYDEALDSIKTGLTKSTAGLVLDLARVTFMNSSGITALSRLVLQARKEGKSLTFVGANEVAWQRKTIPSLKKLYEKLNVELV